MPVFRLTRPAKFCVDHLHTSTSPCQVRVTAVHKHYRKILEFVILRKIDEDFTSKLFNCADELDCVVELTSAGVKPGAAGKATLAATLRQSKSTKKEATISSLFRKPRTAVTSNADKMEIQDPPSTVVATSTGIATASGAAQSSSAMVAQDLATLSSDLSDDVFAKLFDCYDASVSARKRSAVAGRLPKVDTPSSSMLSPAVDKLELSSEAPAAIFVPVSQSAGLWDSFRRHPPASNRPADPASGDAPGPTTQRPREYERLPAPRTLTTGAHGASKFGLTLTCGPAVSLDASNGAAPPPAQVPRTVVPDPAFSGASWRAPRTPIPEFRNVPKTTSNNHSFFTELGMLARRPSSTSFSNAVPLSDAGCAAAADPPAPTQPPSLLQKRKVTVTDAFACAVEKADAQDATPASLALSSVSALPAFKRPQFAAAEPGQLAPSRGIFDSFVSSASATAIPSFRSVVRDSQSSMASESARVPLPPPPIWMRSAPSGPK